VEHYLKFSLFIRNVEICMPIVYITGITSISLKCLPKL